MSTVLLMTDSWQPTVLRLVPFSSNNAKQNETRTNGRHHSARGFPVLAVTRSGSKNNSASTADARSARSASSRSTRSARSDYRRETDNVSEISALTTPVRSSDKGEEHVTKYKKYPQKKVPVTHSEMKEAIRFSVQDLNDQVSSCSSLHSTEDADSREKTQKADNTRTSLPKPSLCAASETKYFSPMNGVRRSVPLTPGEMELQRIRDNFIIEQAQKRKKYKLNVNQLPRSTTPINDHDPDKLNMKQVIAFLQTKTPKENTKRSPGDRKSETSRKTSSIVRRESEASSLSTRQKFSRDSEQVISKPTSETRYVDKTDNTRDINGCVSVLSTKSTPNMPFGYQFNKFDRNPGTAMSVRSFSNRTKDAKSSTKHKPMKEFKLYRFLAIAPEGEKRQGLATSVTESVPNVDITSINYRSKQVSSPDSPRKFLRRRTRDNTTANLLHRRAATKVGNMVTGSKEQPEIPIRLPSMGDSPDEESESCSTTSATYNSTKNGSTNGNFKLPKKEKTITFVDEKSDTNAENPHLQEDENNNTMTPKCIAGFHTKSFKSPEFPKVSINGPRQIHINMPQENKTGYSQEIVRLTLRQEKSTTRVNSYMSDMQSNSPNKWHEEEKTELMEISSSDNRDWDTSTSRQLVNSITNNKFIKVRQKLRTSNIYS